MAKDKKHADGHRTEDWPVDAAAAPEVGALQPAGDRTAHLRSAVRMEKPGDPVQLLAPLPAEPAETVVLDLEQAVGDLLQACEVEREWKLRVCAERLEALAARLRAEWRRRRGE